MVSCLLSSPGEFFLFVKLLLFLGFTNLLCSVGVNFFNLFGSESLEVFSSVSVISMARNGGCGVLSHEIGSLGNSNFKSVLSLLVVFPGVFSIFLSLSQSSVFSLHVHHHLLFLKGCFIFEHSTHAGDSISLSSVVSIFLLLSGGFFISFTLLILNPSLLSGGIISLADMEI